MDIWQAGFQRMETSQAKVLWSECAWLVNGTAEGGCLCACRRVSKVVGAGVRGVVGPAGEDDLSSVLHGQFWLVSAWESGPGKGDVFWRCCNRLVEKWWWPSPEW